MRVADVIKAKEEAKRFLDAVYKLEKEGRVPSFRFYEGGKLTATVKRSSMDLSAALVDLRKSPWRK